MLTIDDFRAELRTQSRHKSSWEYLSPATVPEEAISAAEHNFTFHFNPAPILKALNITCAARRFVEAFYDTVDGFFVQQNVWISERLLHDGQREWHIKFVQQHDNVREILKFVVPEADEIQLGDYIRDVLGERRRPIPHGCVKFDKGVGAHHYLQKFAHSITTRVTYGDLVVDYANLGVLRGEPITYCVATISKASLDEMVDYIGQWTPTSLARLPSRIEVAAALRRSEWMKTIELPPYAQSLGVAVPEVLSSESELDSDSGSNGSGSLFDDSDSIPIRNEFLEEMVNAPLPENFAWDG